MKREPHQHLIIAVIIMLAAWMSACSPTLIEPQTGQKSDIFKTEAEKPLVIVSLAAYCPISLRQSLTMDTLSQQFPQFLFIGIFPKAETFADIDSFRNAVHPQYLLLSDPNNGFIKRYHIQITPEVIVFDAQRKNILYRGALDDRYEALGQHRKHPTRHYLKDALRAVLRGEKPQPSVTKPVGCLI